MKAAKLSKISFYASKGGVSVKKSTLNNFLTVRPIFKINMPINSGQLFAKNIPQNNFSTNEPISTNNIPINSARREETSRNFKTFSKFVSGQPLENFREKITSFSNFQTFN
jgi:hypothetical protein